jgi:hypothetical protein
MHENLSQATQRARFQRHHLPGFFAETAMNCEVGHIHQAARTLNFPRRVVDGGEPSASDQPFDKSILPQLHPSGVPNGATRSLALDFMGELSDAGHHIVCDVAFYAAPGGCDHGLEWKGRRDCPA